MWRVRGRATVRARVREEGADLGGVHATDRARGRAGVRVRVRVREEGVDPLRPSAQRAVSVRVVQGKDVQDGAWLGLGLGLGLGIGLGLGLG